MPHQPLDFRSIRPHDGSQHSGFEEFCCQLAALDSPGRAFHRKGPGADAGVECYRVEIDGTESGWQAKYFLEFGSSQVSQLTESFEHALERHPQLQKYIVCLPINLSDGRVGNQKSQRQRWDDWVGRCVAAAAPRKVDIELWGAFELGERLGRDDPLYSGRRMYWFGGTQLGQDWFRARFDIARAALGERYAPELNVELPIRRALAAFVRDPRFIREVEGWADRLDEAFHGAISYLRTQVTGSGTAQVRRLESTLPVLVRNMRLAPKEPADQLPIDQWQSALSEAAAALEECSIVLWNEPHETESKRDRDAALHFTWRLRDVLEDVAGEMSSPSAALANVRRLLVEGEAGVGKSHLLADVADDHVANGRPAVLILGGMFSDADPWTQTLSHLGLAGTTPDDFLGALDAAAEAAGARAIVMIDAINERQGIAVWGHRLAAFLQTAARFPRVAIVVSCRTTFVPWIVDPQLGAVDLPRITHPGFAGRAAEAARRYLDQRGIVRMAAPALAPEFENPLFLRTCCDLLDRRGETELPRGLSGVTAIFDFYFSAVAETLTLRMGLNRRFRIVERALDALTAKMVQQGTGYIALDEAITLLEAVHSSRGQNEQSLLFQLENEGVIAVEPVEVGGALEEHVRFTFERLSDHRIAARLLDDHVGGGNPAPAFAQGGALERYVEGPDSYRHAGIVEAFAVQLPERYGVELPDLVQSRSARWDLWHPFELSLLWREQKTFTKRTLELVRKLAPSYGSDPVLATLLAIATEPDNSFNADHLDRKLRAMPMPERDEKWSTGVTRLAEEEGNPVETLIEWTLANALHSIEPARARLVGITLAWLLSLSHRAVRDRATKALAALLVTRRRLAAELVRLFADIDDAYILDRVLAAAYGGALRSHSDDGLADVAAAAFDAVFSRDPIPDHALIRDHARGIIELAAYRNALPTRLDPNRARPPYPARRPIEPIGDDVIEQFQEDRGRGAFHDGIYYSAIMDGDFARYVIDRAVGRFLQLPIEDVGRTPKQIFERWRRKAIAPHSERIAALELLLEASRTLHELPHDWAFWDKPRPANAPSKEERERLEAEREESEKELERLLGEDGAREYRIRAAGYVRERAWSPKGNVWRPTHEGEQARRWVAWRAHDLGWTAQRFGEFDHMVPDSGRMEHRIERIGKKYQWIALHELVGRLSDGFAVGRGWREKTGVYQGPWDIDIREMDPSMLVTGTPNRERSDQPATWWAPHAPRWKIDPPAARRAWMADRERDVPDPLKQIDVTDRDGRPWLVLDMSMSRNQWHMVDGERTAHRMTWHKIKCLLVPTAHRGRLLKLLAGSERERDHPPEVELSSDAYLGEYAWHPSCAGSDGSWTLEPPCGRPIPVQATVVDRYTERSGHDYSIEDSFNLKIPAPALMAGLDLRLAEGHALAFAGADGKVLFKDPSAEEPGFSAAVVDRQAFIDFLSRETLEAVWIITGEKSAHGGPTRGEGWGGQLDYWGLYTTAEQALTGTLAFEQKEPRPGQLEAFLAGE
jgi:hypothetical protein